MRRIQANPASLDNPPGERQLSLRRSGKLAVLMIACIVLASCNASEPLEETRYDSFNVGPSPRLEVESDNGHIDVRAGPPGVIVVQATLRNPSKMDYAITRQGDTIRVNANHQSGFGNISLINSPAADIAITAPAPAFVDLQTSNGDIEIEGMRGSGSLQTSNGRIGLHNVKGSFSGSTDNGHIDIMKIEGTAVMVTSNGVVNVEEGRGEFDVETSNGGIFFQGELTPGGKNGFLTSNGSVTVKLEGEPSLRLLATTSNGSVISKIPMASSSTGSENLSGVIGRGDAELIIQASNGSVVLE